METVWDGIRKSVTRSRQAARCLGSKYGGKHDAFNSAATGRGYEKKKKGLVELLH
jgi:hypothetical protein